MTLATIRNSSSATGRCSAPCNKIRTWSIPDSGIQQQDIVSGGKHGLRKLSVGLPGDGVSHWRQAQALSGHMAVHSHRVKEQALVSLQRVLSTSSNPTANTADTGVLARTRPSTVRPTGTSVR